MNTKQLMLLLMSVFCLAACTLVNPTELPLATPLPPSNPVAKVLTATAQVTQVIATPTLITETPQVQRPETRLSPTPAPTRRSTLKPGEKVFLKLIHMITVSTGWAIGLGHPGELEPILRTVDGGKSWSDVTPAGAREGARAAAYFMDERSAWVVYTFTQPPEATLYQQVVWRTRDGGLTWQASQPLDTQMSMENFNISDIGFISGKTGWLLAHLGVGMHHDYVALYTSADSGDTWKRVVDPQRDGLPMSCYKSGVTFIDSQTGWVSGSCGGVQAGYYLYKTADGGTTWSLQALPTPVGSTDLFTKFESVCWVEPAVFLNPNEGSIALGCRLSETETRGWLYLTKNGGQTWQPYPLPVPYGTFDFLNSTQAWYLGSKTGDSQAGSQIYVTSNGGQTWQLISSVNWTGQLSFIDARNGWIVATAGDETALVRSQDGGRTWQLMAPVKAP